MATKQGTGKVFDAIFRPHRFLGLPSIIDPLVNPNDKYNRPKADSIEAPEVTPLPDESSAGVKYRVDQNRRARSGRRGYGSTLITGQLGDGTPPPVQAPLVMGRS